MPSLTFNKCKLGSSNLYFYFDEIVCTKLFINDDHIKIINYDGFKLPIKKINAFLKDLGYVIYIELDSTNNFGTKMFRDVESDKPKNFHDIKKQFQDYITCCFNVKGLKIPGNFQLNEIESVVNDFIEFYNHSNTIQFDNAPQNFPTLYKTENKTAETKVETTVANTVETTVKIDEKTDEKTDEKIDEKTDEKPDEKTNTTNTNDNTNTTNTTTDDTVSTKDTTNVFEKKLLRAEAESRIAQLKHNIAYLEVCLQYELTNLETL